MNAIVGKKFGKLTVVRILPHKKYGQYVLECVCECGLIRNVLAGNLKKGHTISCGRCSKIKNITGQTFGRLIVIRFSHIAHENAYWICKCSCGTEKSICGASLRNGATVSCGCYGREQRIKGCTKHGQSYTKDYERAEVRKRREMRRKIDTLWTTEMEHLLRKVFDRCAVCGKTQQEHLYTWGTSLHVDHVNPLNLGNTLVPGNATVLCNSCNASKSTKSLDELEPITALKIRLSSELFEHIWNNPEIRYSYSGV